LLSHGIDPDALAQAVREQVPYNGSQSTITQREAGAYFDSTRPNLSISEGFRNPGLHAVAQLNGSDVYYRKGGFWFFPNLSINSGTLGHEALHNIGMVDSQVQSLFGVALNPNDTSNITKALEEHDCK
jgi:hypothetical protein